MVDILIFSVVAVFNLILGIFVLYKDPKNKINISFSIVILSIAFWIITVAIALWVKDEGFKLFWTRMTFAGPSVIPSAFLYFAFVFPKAESKINRVAFVFFFVVPSIISLIVAPTDLYVKSVIEITPWGINFVLGSGFPVYTVFFAFYIGLAFFKLVRKYQIYKGADREELKYLFLGTFIAAVVGLSVNLILPLFGITQFNKLGPISTTAIVAFTAYAILKHRLMDISVVISRLVAEILTIIFLGSIYLGLVWLYLNLISTQIDLLFVGWTVLYGIMVGQTHQRIRLFIQTTSNKLFLRGKYDYYKELAEVSSQISRSLSLENIIETLRKTFYEVIEVSSPRIYLSGDLGKPEIKELLSVKEPTFKGEDLILPCVVEDRVMALIVLGKKLSEDPYTDEDLRLLKNLANQTAVALDHQRMYEEMLKTQEQLLSADKQSALGRVAAGLAHEIKNPLAAIKGMTQSIDRNLDDPEFLNDFREVVPKEIDRLNNLVDNLMRLGKTSKLRLSQVDINKLLEGTLKMFEKNCRDHRIKIMKELSPLPEMKADPDQMTQMFTNLILNAIEAMPEGGRLTVGTQSRDNRVIIEIADTGQGIPEDKLKDIFEPFFSTKEEGMGLGLAISYRIIKDHGGEVEVESGEGEGARFRIVL